MKETCFGCAFKIFQKREARKVWNCVARAFEGIGCVDL